KLIFTKVRNSALRAFGFACYADVAAVQYQPVVSIQQERFRYDLFQFSFDFNYILSGSDARAIGYPENMRVDSNGGVAERGIEHDIGCFTANTRKGFERAAVIGDLTVVLLD